MTTPEADLARSFIRDVSGRYAHHFNDLLIQCLDKPNHPLRCLDLSCHVGSGTLAIHETLPAGSLVVALADDRFALKEFHKRLTPELRKEVFPRKESPQRLPFAAATFDLAWANLPTRLFNPIRPILQQALRVLRPGGLLALCVPLKGSFDQLVTGIAKLRLDSSADLPIQRLLAERAQLNDTDEWSALLQRCGAIEVTTHTATFNLEVEPPLSRDRLVSRHLLRIWLGSDNPTVETDELLDETVTEPTEVAVKVGCICGRRGLAEDASSVR